MSVDGEQFDRIARSLGSGRTRRSVIKGVAAGLIAAIAGERSIARATVIMCGGTNDACSHEFDGSTCCITHYCDEETLTCIEHACVFEGERCGGIFIAEESEREPNFYFSCCAGLVCNDSTGVCEATGPVCAIEGESCGDLSLSQEGEQGACCAGLVCNKEAKCAPPVICAAEGETCGELGCCGDLTCLDTKHCGYPAEKPKDPAKPAPGPAPAPPPVVKLPDTGSGVAGAGAEWLIPTALGAAAAAVAAHKLRDASTTAPDDLA